MSSLEIGQSSTSDWIRWTSIKNNKEGVSSIPGHPDSRECLMLVNFTWGRWMRVVEESAILDHHRTTSNGLEQVWIR